MSSRLADVSSICTTDQPFEMFNVKNIQRISIPMINGDFGFTIGGGSDAALFDYDDGFFVVQSDGCEKVQAGDKVIEINGNCVVCMTAAYAQSLWSDSVKSGVIELLILKQNSLFDISEEDREPFQAAVRPAPTETPEKSVQADEIFSLDNVQRVCVPNLNGDFGFTIAGGTDAPLFEYDDGIFIAEVHRDVNLMVGDKVLAINQFRTIGVEESFAWCLWADSFADESIELIVLRQNSLYSSKVSEIVEKKTERSRSRKKSHVRASVSRTRRHPRGHRRLEKWAEPTGPSFDLMNGDRWSANEMFEVNRSKFGVDSVPFDIADYCSV